MWQKLAIAALIAGLCACVHAAATEAGETRTFVDSSRRFSFQYPTGWMVSDSKDETGTQVFVNGPSPNLIEIRAAELSAAKEIFNIALHEPGVRTFKCVVGSTETQCIDTEGRAGFQRFALVSHGTKGYLLICRSDDAYSEKGFCPVAFRTFKFLNGGAQK